VFHFKSAEKQNGSVCRIPISGDYRLLPDCSIFQLVEDGWAANYLINGELERGREGESFETQFKVYVNVEQDSEVSLAFPVGQLVTFPANQLTN